MSTLLAKSIVDQLVEKEKNRIGRLTDEIILKNHSLTKSPAFFFMGKTYGARPTIHDKLPRLDPSLFDEMVEYQKQVQELSFNIIRINQALSLVLMHCNKHQDVRDALHEDLIEYLHPDFAKLKRTRPEAYMLREGTREHKQYYQLRTKIELYLALRLIS